jgi:predicted Zn-dependent protease
VTDAYLKVIVRDADGRTGHWAAASVALADVDPAAVTRQAIAKLPRGALVDLEPGEYPVVLGPEAIAEVLEFLGVLAFNGETFAEGRSAISGRLGTRVASATINLSDSPRFRGTLPRAFDAEGVPKAPLPLIQDGVAHRVVHDTRSAARAGGGARSTGHATEPGGSPFGPVPTNLVLVGGGAVDEHELAQPIERGLYVNRLWYVNPVHEQETILTGVTRDGTFLIEDGTLTRPARDVRFTDSALGLLDRTQALTASPMLVGRSDFYGRRFAFGVVCPAIRASSIRITGGA